MSDKIGHRHADILPIAAALAQGLAPYAERIMIGGSLRRGKELVSDIELIAVPTPKMYRVLDIWLERGAINKRLNKNGNAIAWGNKYRAFIVVDPDTNIEVAVDLFLCTVDNWGLTLLLRTGDGDANKLLVTQRHKAGILPDNMLIKDGLLWVHPQKAIFGNVAKNNPTKSGFRPIKTSTELEFYRLIGFPYFAPYARNQDSYKTWRNRIDPELLKTIMRAVNNPTDLHNTVKVDLPSRTARDRNTNKVIEVDKDILSIIDYCVQGRQNNVKRWMWATHDPPHEAIVYTPKPMINYNMTELLLDNTIDKLKIVRAYNG